jgi:hypothetical protein
MTTPTTMPTPTPVGTTTTARSGEEARLGSIRGDRPCLKCGFNLHGQTILREPHYGLFIVRCPECSSVASLQDYPVLGRWARRWGFVLAGLYLILAVGLFVGGGLATGGFAAFASEQLRNNFSSKISGAHHRWFDSTGQAAAILKAAVTPQQGTDANNTIAYVNNWGPFAAISREWWESTGRAAFRQSLAANPYALRDDDIAAYSLFAFGCLVGSGFLAVFLPGLRRGRLLIIPLVLGGVGLVVLQVAQFRWTPTLPVMPGYVPAVSLAIEEMPPRFHLWVIGGACVLCTLGAFLGRPAARGLIRFLLPPRNASAFSFLWEADGRTFRPSGTTAQTPTSRAGSAGSPPPGT